MRRTSGRRTATPYIARTYGKAEPDGTWVGWLEFSPRDTADPVLRTDRETSQATHAALETWALGLESTYLEGAFARATCRIEATRHRRLRRPCVLQRVEPGDGQETPADAAEHAQHEPRSGMPDE